MHALKPATVFGVYITRSRQGVFATCNDCTTSTTSSTHAEMVAGSTNSNDVVWSRGLLWEYGLYLTEPTPFYVDAKNVLTLVQNLVSSKATRHITRRELVVRDREADGTLVVTRITAGLDVLH